MGQTFGFNLDDAKDPAVKIEFAQFIAALQQFSNAFSMQDVPFDISNLYGSGGLARAVDHVFNTSEFRVMGDVMEWSFTFVSVVVGAGVNALLLRVPNGYKVGRSGQFGIGSTAGWMFDGGLGVPSLIQYSYNDDHITVSRSDLAALTNTVGAATAQIRGQIRLKVIPPT